MGKSVLGRNSVLLQSRDDLAALDGAWAGVAGAACAGFPGAAAPPSPLPFALVLAAAPLPPSVLLIRTLAADQAGVLATWAS